MAGQFGDIGQIISGPWDPNAAAKAGAQVGSIFSNTDKYLKKRKAEDIIKKAMDAWDYQHAADTEDTVVSETYSPEFGDPSALPGKIADFKVTSPFADEADEADYNSKRAIFGKDILGNEEAKYRRLASMIAPYDPERADKMIAYADTRGREEMRSKEDAAKSAFDSWNSSTIRMENAIDQAQQRRNTLQSKFNTLDETTDEAGYKDTKAKLDTLDSEIERINSVLQGQYALGTEKGYIAKEMLPPPPPPPPAPIIAPAPITTVIPEVPAPVVDADPMKSYGKDVLSTNKAIEQASIWGSQQAKGSSKEISVPEAVQYLKNAGYNPAMAKAAAQGWNDQVETNKRNQGYYEGRAETVEKQKIKEAAMANYKVLTPEKQDEVKKLLDNAVVDESTGKFDYEATARKVAPLLSTFILGEKKEYVPSEEIKSIVKGLQDSGIKSSTGLRVRNTGSPTASGVPKVGTIIEKNGKRYKVQSIVDGKPRYVEVQ